MSDASEIHDTDPAPAPELTIVDHRLCGPGVSYRESPNRGGTMTPSYLVLHYTASVPTKPTIDFLCSPASKASAHFVVDYDGSITQLVPCNRKAWHAGPSEWAGRKGCNDFTLGVEIMNPGPLLEDGRTLAIDRLKGGGIRKGAKPWTGRVVEARHRHPGWTYRYWCAYTDEQLLAVAELSRLLVLAYRLRGVVGHEDVAPGRKGDPGPAWPWEEFRKALALDESVAKMLGMEIA